MNHAPTPWVMIKSEAMENVYHVDAGPTGHDNHERTRVATMVTSKANAAYICKAVNAHEGLVKAVRELLLYIDTPSNELKVTMYPQSIDYARAALALATKEN